MVVWLRPQCILAIVTSLYFCSQLVSSKSYEYFWCTTEEGHHLAACPDETALLTDVTIRKVFRRTQSCDPDFHSDYLVHCEEFIDGSFCEGNRTCSIEVSSRNYIKCADKPHPPTYFLVKFTCTQIYTMCSDVTPIRNTLYGFIVSPAYPHPMADDLICSINIEAGPSMYIELSPIQIRLQDATKCRLDYLEVFGYINPMTNSSYSEDMTSNKVSKNIWKSYYTWCGAEQSINNPLPNSRYLISSNSIYIALHTGVSKKSRYFKIRYKVVPPVVRSQYNADGIVYDTVSEPITHSSVTSTTTKVTTIAVPTVQINTIKSINGTSPRKPFRREIIIGIIAGIVVLVIAIVIGIGIFIFLKKRRRSSTNTPATTSKSTPSSSSNNTGKKNLSSPTTANSTPLKPSTKSTDKAPLLEQSISTAGPSTTAKRKLVPERTVQIADLSNSRYKSALSPTTASHTGAIGKDTNTPKLETASTSTVSSTLKTALTVADSGIYGADLGDDVPPVTTKPTVSIESPKIYGADLPDKSDPVPPIIVVMSPLNENPTVSTNNTATTKTTDITTTNTSNTIPTSTTNATSNTTSSSDSTSITIPKETLEEEKEVRFSPQANETHFDETVKSAYSHLIDATMSENEGTFGGGSLTSSAVQSRRTSAVRQPLLSHETNNIETMPRKTTQFNPLHMILKKDANKYYTTEYI